jgi:hypothetical protein
MLAELLPQVADTFRIIKTEGMGPRFREDDGGVFVAPCENFPIQISNSHELAFPRAARVELLVYLPSTLRGDGTPKGAPW